MSAKPVSNRPVPRGKRKGPEGSGPGEKRVTGVEPATLCLASIRSSQLSYTRIATNRLAKLRGQVKETKRLSDVLHMSAPAAARLRS